MGLGNGKVESGNDSALIRLESATAPRDFRNLIEYGVSTFAWFDVGAQGYGMIQSAYDPVLFRIALNGSLIRFYIG